MAAVGCMSYYMTCSLLLLHCHTYIAFWRFLFLIVVSPKNVHPPGHSIRNTGNWQRSRFNTKEVLFYGILCNLWDSLMFVEKFQTFYHKELLKNVRLSCSITESKRTIQQDIKIKAWFVCFYIKVTLQGRSCFVWVPISPE